MSAVLGNTSIDVFIVETPWAGSEGETVQNSLMASKPGADLWVLVKELMVLRKPPLWQQWVGFTKVCLRADAHNRTPHADGPTPTPTTNPTTAHRPPTIHHPPPTTHHHQLPTTTHHPPPHATLITHAHIHTIPALPCGASTLRTFSPGRPPHVRCVRFEERYSVWGKRRASGVGWGRPRPPPTKLGRFSLALAQPFRWSLVGVLKNNPPRP